MRTTLIHILILLSFWSYGQGNGLYKFKSDNGQYGFIDKTGKIIIQPQFFITNDFSEGLAFVSKEVIKKGYKWICIDTLGNEVFDIKDNFPETDFSEGFARISSFDEQWFINKKGVNEFNRTWIDGHGKFNYGIAYVSDQQFSNFYKINNKGERVDDKTFSRVEIYNSTIKNKSKKEITFEYKSDQYRPFKKNDLWGFKNSQDSVVIEPSFYKIDKFKNGICAVRIKKQEFEFANDYFLDAVINENGKVLNEINMHCYMGFQGVIMFFGGPHFSGGVHYLNKKGEKIIPKE